MREEINNKKKNIIYFYLYKSFLWIRIVFIFVFVFFFNVKFFPPPKNQINHSYVSVSAFFLCTVFIPSVFSVARNSTPLPARGMHRKFAYGHVIISWWLVPFASGDRMGGQLRCSFPIFVVEFERGF